MASIESTNQASRPAPVRRTRSRRAVAGAAVAVCALVLSACWSDNQEKDLGYVNQSRRANGKANLNGDSDLMARAQAWSENMARTGRLEHSGGGGNINTNGIANWCGVAENVSYAGSTYDAHQSFMNSPPHRVNVLGNYDRVGTGVVRVGNTVWLTELYVRSC